MDAGGAYGGGKAGGAFDPITFVQRPQVILRAVCWVNVETVLKQFQIKTFLLQISIIK